MKQLGIDLGNSAIKSALFNETSIEKRQLIGKYYMGTALILDRHGFTLRLL